VTEETTETTKADEKPEITLATRTRGLRTFQYYGLRHRWEWRLSSKTRDLVAAMRGAWGSEVDIVTMLGAEPRAPYQDWQRYDAQFEVVDLGRNKVKAEEILEELKKEAQAEKALREHAARDLVKEIRDSVEAFAQRCKEHQEGIARSITKNGIVYTAKHKDIRRAAIVDFQREWAEGLAEREGALIGHIRTARTEAKRELLNGKTKGDTSWNANEVEHAIARAKGDALVQWKNKLTEWIKSWTAWEEAKKKIADRKLHVLATKITEKTGKIS